MQLDKQHQEILQDIASFASIERYRGMLPAKLALCYDAHKIDELVHAGLVERMQISYACGQESVLLKLTEQGDQALDRLRRSETVAPPTLPRRKDKPLPRDCGDLSPERLRILSDIQHFTGIHRFGGLMPQSEAENYAPQDLNELYAQGFVIRVKVELGTGEKRKGYILSDKGLRCLGRD